MELDSAEHEAQPDERVSALVNEYFDRRQAGEQLTPEHFAGEHPELAHELRPYLEGLTLVERARSLASGAGGGLEDSGATELPAIAGYQLIEEIGRGGMGVVYRALQVSTKRIVAVKVMLAGPFASASAQRRFAREVELAARLQHPNIVGVLESGEVGGQRYYAMQYVDGVRLDHYFPAERPDVRATLNLFVQLCEAVEYAHGHGVVHRDLKPANVLIDDDRHPHILDFGLAKAIAQPEAEDPSISVSLLGQILGTLFYLSPEQAAGAPAEIDARTDVYSLGVMLFEALTGSLPFDTAGRPSEIIQRVLEAAPTPPSSLSSRVNSELETLILKALEKDKARRYQSARDLAADIRRYLAGEPILARRPSRLYVVRKKLVKHRLPVALSATVVVLALAGVLYGFWSRQRGLERARWYALTDQQRLEEGTVDMVVGSAKVAYARHPKVPEVRLVWAQAQYRNVDTREQAIRFLESQLQRHPSRWECRALLAEIYQTTDPVRAEALRARAEHEAPDTAEGWYIRSLATLDQQRALFYAQRAADRDPAHVLAWRRVTWLRLQVNDLEGAFQGADRLIELGQSPVQWTLFKGHVLARQGRFRESIQQYTWVIGVQPEYSSGYRCRAHVSRRMHDYERAAADYTKALKLDGEVAANLWDLYQRGTVLWILGRTDQALEDYQRVRRMRGQPSFSDARWYLVLRTLGEQRRAEADQVLENALRDTQEPWLRSIFECLRGQLTPADLIAAATARDNLESLCEAYYYAGEVYLLSNRPAEARRCFEQCVQTDVGFDLDSLPLSPMNEYELAEWRLGSPPADSSPSGP